MDYHRRYSRAYNVKFRRVSIRGIKLFKDDVDILRALCEVDGRTLEEEIVSMLENMAEKVKKIIHQNGSSRI
jgi:methyl coenzyme M reductase beta subunit